MPPECSASSTFQLDIRVPAIMYGIKSLYQNYICGQTGQTGDGKVIPICRIYSLAGDTKAGMKSKSKSTYIEVPFYSWNCVHCMWSKFHSRSSKYKNTFKSFFSNIHVSLWKGKWPCGCVRTIRVSLTLWP